MKKLIFIPVFVLLLFCQMSLFANTDIEAEIYSSFHEIENVIEYISIHEDASFNDLAANNLSTANLSSSAAIASNMNSEDGEPPLLSPFWWGCIFGPVGIVVVAVTSDNNKEYIRKSVLGCAIPVGCSLISWIAYYAYVALVVNSIGV